MSATPRSARGPWASAGRLADRTPMRVKLITVVLTLVAIALLTISVAGLGFLRSFLLGQADSVLSSESATATAPHGIDSTVAGFLHYGQGQPLPNGEELLGWIPAGSSTTTWVYREGRGYMTGGSVSFSYLPVPGISQNASWLSGGKIITVSGAKGYRFRVLALPGQALNLVNSNGQQVTGTVIVAWDVTSVYQTLGKLTGIDIIVSAVLLALIAVIGVTVIRASLRPLADIEETAEAIAAGELSRRVPDQDPRTEVGRLGNSLNTMLAQIEAAFQARSASEAAARKSEDKMRQFVADASHELRTPLTAIRGFAEYYRQRGGVATTGPAQLAAASARPELTAGRGPGTGAGASTDRDSAEGAADPAGAQAGRPGRIEPGGHGEGQLAPAELDRIMRRVEQEASRMGILVEDMLLLARLDQQRPLEHQTVDLLTLAADAVHDARVVAPSRDINLTVGAGAALLVLGDEVRLRQVIGNLMSNALSHTPDGTAIDVRIRSGSVDEARFPGDPDVARARSAAVLEVTDHGPGLSQEQAERVFERFYRADQARTSGGSGLGLAIVASLVAAHGGAVWVQSAPGAGATFRIALPLAPEALDADDDADAGDFSELTS
jgi:signal transduction histidine kinase